MTTNKLEWNVVLGLTLFAVVWVLLVLPMLVVDTTWISLAPPFKYLIYNLGFIALTCVSFGLTLSLWKNEYSLFNIFKNGITSWLGISFVYDLWQPPFYINKLGDTIQSEKISALADATSDGTLFYIYNNIFPSLKNTIFFDISLLYVCIYIFTPFLIILLMLYVFSSFKFFRNAGGVI